MFWYKLFPLVTLCLAVAALTDVHAAPARADVRCDLAIVDANVISMDRAQTRLNRTVRVGGGRILSIAFASGDRGGGCKRIIDARGRYLVPGLNDAHVHVETNAFTKAFGLQPVKFDYEAVLALYLAHGVTGVRVLSGAPDLLAFRKTATEAPVPRLVISSPMLSGDPPVMPEPLTRVVTDIASARAAVAEFLNKGYDFIKIRSNLSREVFAAVLDEAHARGAYVDGHVTRAVGAEAAIRAGQDAFAHLYDLAAALKTPGDFKRMVALLRSCGCFVSTTLSVTRSIVDQLTDYDGMLARPEMKYLHPLIVHAFWLKPNNPYFAQKTSPGFYKELHRKSKILLKDLVAAGAAVVAGTDAMNPMIIPGVSLHDELQMMTDAGLTPWQALKTATADTAKYVPGFADVGVLEKGRTATAILVSGNPLKDLQVLRRPDAVLLAGRWLGRDALDALLARAAAQGGSK